MCGKYTSFLDNSDTEVNLVFSSVKAIGQVVDLHGEMFLGSLTTSVVGHLNAKSNQFELIPLANNLIAGLEPGGMFVGLQGSTLFGWKPPRLDNPGGRLELRESCDKDLSKSPAVRSVWRS